MDKRALLVGINRYDNGQNLKCCVNDARDMRELLARNADGKPNYGCRSLLDDLEPGEDVTRVTRGVLRGACTELFDYAGPVLLYFSGHGILTKTGGYLATSDAEEHDLGVSMQEIMDLATVSQARDILLILDCCHSGSFGNLASLNKGNPADPLALVRENMTVIAASHATEPAVEAAGHGMFTAAVLDALHGGAADHMGWITGPAIYAYVERRFGAWAQRPVYKSHMTQIPCGLKLDRSQEKLVA